jgi:hypothetical protein
VPRPGRVQGRGRSRFAAGAFVAQWQSGRFLTGGLQVRVLPDASAVRDGGQRDGRSVGGGASGVDRTLPQDEVCDVDRRSEETGAALTSHR